MAHQYVHATRAQAEAYIHHDVEAFGGEPEPWLRRLDDPDYLARIRVMDHGGEVAAGLCYFDAGQWFGGRRLGCWAIGGVVTAPTHRGSGVGRQMMLAMLREARDRAVPLSALYASTPTFYRRCGYEPAGWHCAWSVDSDELPRARGDAAIRPFQPDEPDVRDLYRRWAAGQNGTLDRDALLWAFKLAPDRGRRFRYRFDFDGRIEGYVSISGDRSDGLGVEDCVATTVRARRAILTFLHDHRSVNGKVKWYAGPNDPLGRLIDENSARLGPRTEPWLLRLTDVSAALAQRGYAKVHAELHLDVADASLPDNAGRYVLSVRGGEPTVQRGGSGRIALDVRGLTALYTGHMTAEEVADADLAAGPADDLAAATLAFSGARPFMIDKF